MPTAWCSVDWTAVGTIASAVFVGVQAVLTRRLVQSARKGEKAAEQTLAASRQMVLEATKQRQDARARLIQIMPLDGYPQLLSGEAYGEPQPIADRRAYQVPRQAEERIILRQRLRITSGGPIYVNAANLRYSVPEPLEVAKFELIPTGENLFVNFDVNLSVEDWIIRSQGTFGAPRVHIWVIDGFDEGTCDGYPLALHGTPLVQDPGLDGGWIVHSTEPSNATVPRFSFEQLPMKRTYYQSREKGVELGAEPFAPEPSVNARHSKVLRLWPRRDSH